VLGCGKLEHFQPVSPVGQAGQRIGRRLLEQTARLCFGLEQNELDPYQTAQARQ